jgi:hypothetical protein
MLSESHEKELYDRLRSEPSQIAPVRTASQRLGHETGSARSSAWASSAPKGIQLPIGC